jgi:hypothetical protein
MAVRYGILSDMHEHPELIIPLLQYIEQREVSAYILNGDVGQDAPMIVSTVGAVAKSGRHVFVQPGSHESVGDFTLASEYMKTKFGNIIPITKPYAHQVSDHTLLFMPGSDWQSHSGQYGQEKDVPTSSYVRSPEGLVPVDDEQFADFVFSPGAAGILFSNACYADLHTLVTDPATTVLFCHVPPRFDKPTSVDHAYFAHSLKDKRVMSGMALEHQIRQEARRHNLILTDSLLEQIARQNGFELHRENRGNEYLREELQRAGITKLISGHFHESVHHAHDLSGNYVQPNGLVPELFYNASYVDGGKAAVITVDGDKISYENISLN